MLRLLAYVIIDYYLPAEVFLIGASRVWRGSNSLIKGFIFGPLVNWKDFKVFGRTANVCQSLCFFYFNDSL